MLRIAVSAPLSPPLTFSWCREVGAEIRVRVVVGGVTLAGIMEVA